MSIFKANSYYKQELKTLKFALIFFAFCIIGNVAHAQSYSIKSFEGETVEVHLKEKSNDKARYHALVYCLTDSLFLADYNYIKKVQVLNKKFLEVIYNTRGGSGYQSRNTAILCVKENKLHVATLVNSFGRVFGGDADESRYLVNFNIIGDDNTNFKLVAHIYDKHNSISDPKKNYNKNNEVILNFDPARNIFYSTYQIKNQSFTVNDPKTQRPTHLYINGSLPTITLGQVSYYNFKGEWYTNGYNNTLFKECYK